MKTKTVKQVILLTYDFLHVSGLTCQNLIKRLDVQPVSKFEFLMVEGNHGARD